MEGRRFIHKITLKNILSYGSEGVSIDLQPLNIIIGTNASGKSNLIEAIGLLQAAPADLAKAFAKGGGVNHWFWKGNTTSGLPGLEVVVELVGPGSRKPLVYSVLFGKEQGDKLYLDNEVIKEAQDDANWFYNKSDFGFPSVRVLNGQTNGHRGYIERQLEADEIKNDRSILSQKEDRFYYPEITRLAEQFSSIRIYRRWSFEPEKPPRLPQLNTISGEFLYEDASNLVGVIDELSLKTSVYDSLLANLRQLYPMAKRLQAKSYATTKELFLTEETLQEAIPAARLSEGTLRYLSLLAILLHPAPPPLICLEEPEQGIHPDLLSILAELIIEASQRTQIILTTQSDMLLSALSQVPESVIVCEKDEKGSHLRRLSTEQLKEWLEAEPLGQIWMRGLVGGTRW